MKKKLVSLMLCLVLVLSTLGACSKPAKDTGGDSSITSAPTDNSAAVTTTVEDEWTWPLSEKKELNIWIAWQNDYLENPSELKAVQKMEELTNVHVNWTVVNGTEAAEKFSLMISSGEYPDIIRGAEAYYSGGLVKMVNDGVSIDLTDSVEKYMPNYTALRNSSEKLKKDTVTDDGKTVAIYTIASKTGEVSGERIWGGLGIRQDWLDETGLAMPETIDDWHNVLTAIKANHPECEAPLMIGSTGVDAFGSFISAFGVLKEFCNVNGTVKYGPAEDGYKQYVSTLRQWYSEGLIDPNFMSNDASFLASADIFGTGKATAGNTLWGFTADTWKKMGYNTDENFWISAAPYPVMNDGDTPEAGFATSELVKETTVITSSCKDVELAMRFLDFNFTKEAMMINGLGIEGETYKDNGDGTYSLTDSLLASVTDGTYPTTAAAIFSNTLGTSSFGLYDWGMFNAIYEGNRATEAYDVWNTAKFDLMLPPCMTMTDEESQEYASLYTNVQTLVQENTVAFILGKTSMDEYDSFVEQLHTFGMDRCIELKQAALDRYNARSN